MTQSPTVLILAAGANSRFFPFNTTTHKGAIELMGEPLIVKTLRNLEEHKLHDVVIVVSEKDYGGKGLSGVLANYQFNLSVQFVLQPKADGMGDAVLCAKEYIHDSFVVVFPNSLDAGDLVNQLVKFSGEHGALAVSETQEPWLYGIVTLDGDRVTHIVEKPERGSEPSNLKVFYWLLSKKYLDVLEKTSVQQYSFEAALEEFFKDHEVKYYKHQREFSLKYPWHLFDIEKYLFGQIQSSTHSTAQVAPTAIIDDTHGPVIIAEGAKINHAAKVVGPVYIGKNVLIGDFSFVRGGCIEEGVTIGSYTEVVRSIIMANSEIHYGYLADSIIGRNVKIGGGLLTANKRHDRKNVMIEVKGEKVDIGRNNFGVMIGDTAKIGVRVTTMPGVVIGSEAVVWPSMTLFENVDQGEIQKD